MGTNLKSYWNPYLETLPREKLQAIQLKRFREILSYAKNHSMLYSRKFQAIEPEAITTLDHIRELPLIDKDDLRGAQDGKEPFPFGEMLGVPPEDATTFRQTSGTTGKPVYVPESTESWQWRVEVWCHILWMAGFRETDRVFLPFGYNVYVAFWEGHYAAEKLGCLVVPGGALDTKGRVNKILEIQATALLMTPTYGLHLAEEAEKMGIAPHSMGIKRMQCAGEPLPQATRRKLEDIWGAEVYDHIGGTEPCAWAAMCGERNGLHIMEPFVLVECLDMETLTREVDEGELGVAVVTPLGRRSFPLIRFNTKDVVRKALIRAEFPEIVEYEIIVERKGVMDEISLKVEPKEKTGEAPLKDLTARLSERLKVKTNLTFRIHLVAPGELPRYTLKSHRFKDLRGEEGGTA
jgi:phenylacetate-CoA ligase